MPSNSETDKPTAKENSTYVEQKIQEMERVAQLVSQPGWKVMMMELDRQASKALEKLIEVPPWQTDQVQELQDTIKRFKWFRDTPGLIVQAGENELELMEQEEAEIEEGAYDDG